MKTFLLIIFGGLAGILGGMGMGGGTILIPMLTLIMGIGQHQSQGINLIVFIPMAIITLIIHFKNKLVKVKTAIPIMVIGVGSSIAFAILANKLSSKILSKSFAIFLIILGLIQGVTILCKIKKEKKKENM